jgi:purine-binding chemotaxis protein CheW
VPLGSVIETMRPLPIEPIAAMPPFVLGLSIVRGAAIPVVDAGRILHCAENPSTTRFISLRAGKHTVALAVEAVAGVKEVAIDAVAALPPLLSAGKDELIETIGALDRELLLVLRAGFVVPSAAWIALEGRQGSS